MTQGANKNSDIQGDGGDIDRIIQEIEEMEKNLDQVESKAFESKQANESNVVSLHGQSEPSADVAIEATVDEQNTPVADPVGFDQALRAATARSTDTTSDVSDYNEGQSHQVGQGGDLSLSVGGCTSITLDFSRAGMSVTLAYDDDALTITTDSGAEFRVPFRRAA